MKEKTVTRREYNPEEGYYEWKEIKTGKYVFDEEDKIAIAREYRRDNPRLGSVKLWVMLKRQFDETGCFPGRDTFIGMLRRNGLMVRIKIRHHYVTTDSNHNYRRYPNLVKGLRVLEPNRVWVSDITYVETSEGVCYLSLVTDLYSHKIVGWAVGPTLDTTYPLQALEMALSALPDGDAPGLIHHSDRGCQYCSSLYVDTLKSRKIQISMTQSGDPLENAVAERANGILKYRNAAGKIRGKAEQIMKKGVLLHRRRRGMGATTIMAQKRR